MKLINKTIAFLLLAVLGLPSLESKPIEFLLDGQTEKVLKLEAEIPEARQENPFNQTVLVHYCEQLKIENIGNKPILNFFPYNNQVPFFTLEDLADKIADQRYPLLALFQHWNRSMICDSSAGESKMHPLDLLNFKGACSRTAFHQQFVKLCNALGIETRLTNVQGREVYDFWIDDEWNFLDVDHHQLYLELDNEKLASSENVMDDPFLLLRTKHAREAKQFDFAENWKQLAAFDILEPASAVSVMHETENLAKRKKGFDLFPGETILFENSPHRADLAPFECGIEHQINLESRHVALVWKHRSPFPVRQLKNKSNAKVLLVDQKIELQPGEVFTFNEDVFKVRLKFSCSPEGQISLSGICAWTLFPELVKGKNHIHLGVKRNPSLVRFHYEVNEALENNSSPTIHVRNESHHFDFVTPFFKLESNAHQKEQIWWQIGLDPQFTLVPSCFDQVEPWTSSLALPMISETFISPGNTYYFRAKVLSDGQWSQWSKAYEFKVNKPAAVEEVLFEQLHEGDYELNWERYAEEKNDSLEYLIFGSNSLDFLPSIYYEKQINAIVNDQATEEEINDNLIAITHQPKFRVDGKLAYYRIVARQKGQYSVPSRIIQVYDHDLIQPRNVLQKVKDETQFIAKRMMFPAHYPWTKIALPFIKEKKQSENLVAKIQLVLRSAKKIDKKIYPYEFPTIPDDVWEEVTPFLLPENHPAWAKLSRVFCKTRATQSSERFQKAGFRRWRPGRWSRVSASSHPEFPEFFIKAYCDTEVGIIYDWKKWIHRIQGAECIRECIKKYQLQSHFKVPHKWLYPLPKHPSPPNNSHFVRKNFILVCENMRIEEHSKNEKMYKKNFNRSLMDGLYTILQVCGLYDSVYVFNMPFCKDGKIAIIDTEYHHKWPVPFQKLNNKFSSAMQSYWKKITLKGGNIPNGVSLYNPPRMDRRDCK